jgi:ubiquinone/menaquinone biosynthesis C-methylase UbiE
MTDQYKHIYQNEADLYERLIAHEDYRGNIFQALMEIHSLNAASIVEFGAGTGRLTRIMSVLAKFIYAFDLHRPMLLEAYRVLTETGMENWSFVNADSHSIPLKSNIADIVIEGWSFGHVMRWHAEDWQSHINHLLSEMQRLLKANGTMILIETMGTGQREPSPPAEHLAILYRYWEEEYDFNYRWIRTDFQFESVAEADELIRFFFGDEMADRIVAGKNIIIPECTGIWWKTVP